MRANLQTCNRPDHHWLPYLLLVLTVLFWSGNFVLGRGIRDVIPPVSLNYWRWVGALIIILPFGAPRIRRQAALFKKHWLLPALLSIPSITIFNTCIYTALQTATAMNTVLLNAMTPVFIALLAGLIFGERMRPRQIVGVMISFIGLVFIITRGNPRILLRLQFSSGDPWTLAAGLSWALYSVLLRRRPPEMDPIAFLTLLIAFGVASLTPVYVWEISTVGGFALSATSLASLVYVCVFPSVLAYIFWNRGVAAIGPNRAGIFFHLMPVFSILLAAVFLDERLQAFHLLGMALIFTGIGLTTWPQGNAAPRKETKR